VIPWGLLSTNPELVILIPFAWFLWQAYAPRLIDFLVGSPDSNTHVYQTWWTRTKGEFKSEFDRVDKQIEEINGHVKCIADTQEDLVDITVAQSQLMNGSGGHMDAEAVENQLRNDDENRPSDYLQSDEEYNA